ncbi:MAG: hypothetical protein KA885_01120 [Spirochaetes bacterium]|nr:hypothetical protein [Spirochaetota bacterium]
MRTIVIETTDKSYNQVINLIKKIPDIKYYDDEDDVFTEEDEKAYIKAKKELENGETKSWDELKKELNLV